MNFRLFGVVALAGAVAVGALGYALGTTSQPTREANATPVALNDVQRREVEKLIGSYATANASTTLSETQRSEVKGLIRSHLVANPEILTEVITALQTQEAEQTAAAQSEAIGSNADKLFSNAGDFVLGNPDGDVTLVEFFDYNCGYCRRAVADVQHLMENDPELRLVLKEFPVLGPASVEAARVSVAVRELARDKFEDFHFMLLEEQGQVDGERAIAVAEELGVDPDAIRAHLETDESSNVINDVYSVADQLNLTGTPTFVTKDEVVVGAVGAEMLLTKIADARTQ